MGDVSSVRRICLAVDAQGYSAGGDDRQFDFQVAIETILTEATDRAGLRRSSWATQPGGDGSLSVLPPSEPETQVVDDFVRQVVTRLHRFNADRVDSAWLRLRIAVDYGRLQETPTGFAGPTPIRTARMLDSSELKQALKSSPGSVVALMLSDRVYEDNVASQHTSFDPAEFHRVDVAVKEFRDVGWIWVAPPRTVHAGSGERRDPSSAGSGTAGHPDGGTDVTYHFHETVTTRDGAHFGPRYGGR
jgi:hypothetical protein